MSGYLVPAKKLASALLEHLKLGPRTTEELCNHFGYTSSPIRHRLRDLEYDGLVRHEKLVYTDGGGSYYLWHAGKRTGALTSRPAPLANPQNRGPLVIRRDPLVAAFFGPAPAALKQSAPCCTRCHMEQGTGHQAGCIVAMVAA